MHCPLRASSDINATRQEEAGNLCLEAERGNVKAAGASAIIQGETCTTKQAAITPGAPAFALLAWPWLPVPKAGASRSGSQLHLS